LYKIIKPLRTATNKAGFMLQLGYFKANGKFFTAERFRQKDIEYVAKILGLDINKINLSKYQKKIPQDHRKKILTMLCWSPLDASQQKQLAEQISWHTKNQLSPKQILLSIINSCWQNKIEIPSYNQLAVMITKTYNQRESYLTKKLSKRIKKHDEQALNTLVGISKSGKPKARMQRPPITQLRNINQSLRPTGIQENIKAFKTIKSYFYQFQGAINQLALSDQATEYHATWVQKAETFQLSNFSNKNKLYLHLLAYIKHQFYFRQDILVDIFLKSVRAAINTANKQLQNKENSTRSERNKTIKKLSVSNKDSRLLIEEITTVVKSPALSEKGKISKIEELIDQYHTQYNEQEQKKLIKLENSLNKLSKTHFLLIKTHETALSAGYWQIHFSRLWLCGFMLSKSRMVC
jgi:hypothetical protein